MKARPEGGRNLTVQYEQLRRDHLLLSGPGRQMMPGMVLFLRSGMAAWLHAISRCLTERPPTEPVVRTEVVPSCPYDLRAQAVSILAGMILK